MDYRPEDQPFWHSDPNDRFNWYAITIILAAIACGVIAWGMM